MLNKWLEHITFAYPWILPLLLAVPFMIYWYIKKSKQQTASFTVTTTHFLHKKTTWKVQLRHLPFILRCLALVSLIIALARPQHKFTEQQTDGEGIDIVLCFDISGSMVEGKDLLPNRLDASKLVASDFVRNRPGDRIGVTIFSGRSFTLCPITTDHNTVLSQINSMQTYLLADPGTSVGSGIATSVDRLRTSKAKSKIIILLTDGVDYGGRLPPDIAKDMAITYGIKIYTIGVGSTKEMDVEVESALGKTTQRKKMEFNENLLKMIAEETGGQYFHATDNNGLKQVYNSINQLEKTKVQITSYNRFTDEYFWFLVVGLGLIVIELLLRLSILKKFP
jgi:Ca-activated chloride channel family protein